MQALIEQGAPARWGAVTTAVKVLLAKAGTSSEPLDAAYGQQQHSQHGRGNMLHARQASVQLPEGIPAMIAEHKLHSTFSLPTPAR